MRRNGRIRMIGLVTALIAGVWLGPLSAETPQAGKADVLVFAAASLQTALDELAPQIQQATGVHMKASYAASSALARQIESAAPADIFMSADLDWMDYLAQRHLIKDDTRVNLLGNDLVLVAPASKPLTLRIAPGFKLAAALGDGRLAIADPASVPAGKYGKAALTSLGVWDSVSSKLAQAENVRAALLLVSTGEAPLGIVYRTDAMADKGVKVVDVFPEASHAPIIYPAALTSTAQPDAARVLTYLRGAPAAAVFARLGFQSLQALAKTRH